MVIAVAMYAGFWKFVIASAWAAIAFQEFEHPDQSEFQGRVSSFITVESQFTEPEAGSMNFSGIFYVNGVETNQTEGFGRRMV